MYKHGVSILRYYEIRRKRNKKKTLLQLMKKNNIHSKQTNERSSECQDEPEEELDREAANERAFDAFSSSSSFFTLVFNGKYL